VAAAGSSVAGAAPPQAVSTRPTTNSKASNVALDLNIFSSLKKRMTLRVIGRAVNRNALKRITSFFESVFQSTYSKTTYFLLLGDDSIFGFYSKV
jgi:hypothetical protein